MKRQFRADLPTWILFGGFSCFTWLIAWANSSLCLDIASLVIAVAISGLAFAWLYAFQIVLMPTKLTFRSLFRGRRSIRHDQIRKVRLTWSLQRCTRGPLRLVVEPRDGTGVREFDINAKVFSRAAINAVLDWGARVAEADDGGLRDGVVMKTLRAWKQRHET
jgi:hypothetical protein